MNVQRALIAQLCAKLAPAQVTLVGAESCGWASVTFSGERHEITLLVEGDEAARVARNLQRTIGCEEFHISGHLVADILVNNTCIDEAGVRLDIEVLTVLMD